MASDVIHEQREFCMIACLGIVISVGKLGIALSVKL